MLRYSAVFGKVRNKDLVSMVFAVRLYRMNLQSYSWTYNTLHHKKKKAGQSQRTSRIFSLSSVVLKLKFSVIASPPVSY